MPTFIALLRAVNVAGSGPLRMSDLEGSLTVFGCSRVQTLLASGNAVLSSSSRAPATLEHDLERHLASTLGLRTEVFLRTSDEWGSVIADNPFPREAKEDPGHLLVTVLKSAPTDERWDSLRAAIRGRERVASGGRHAYVVYPDGVGRSKLTPALIEAQLGTRGTSRNWNTVLKLGRLAAETGSSDSRPH